MDSKTLFTLLTVLLLSASFASADGGFFEGILNAIKSVFNSVVEMFAGAASAGEVTLRHGDLMDFSSGKLSSGDVYPECDLEETPFAENGRIQGAGIRTCMMKDNIANIGLHDFSKITSVPQDAVYSSNPQAVKNHVYIVKTRMHGYVKLKVTGVPGEDTVKFVWAHLPGTWSDSPTTTGTTFPSVCDSTKTSNELYQDYISAYGKLSEHMKAGTGDSPQAQEDYQKFVEAKMCYEASLR
ncbi:MAG TPA: hypothetical protein ENN13_01045 [Candidatus Altiarchaeales archaeon]|nr:hypothetical protein [Candidatus Altiarchaeales archaeon]